MSECPFCPENLERYSFWYYESNKYVIMDAVPSGKPMIVNKKHKKNFSSAEIKELTSIIHNIFGKGSTLSFESEKVQDHAHCYIAPTKKDEK